VGTLRFLGVLLGFALAAACARGTLAEDELDSTETSGQGGTIGNGGSSVESTTTQTATTSVGNGGAPSSGGSGGDGGCGPQEHECSGNCTGNTPQSGCYQSQTCTPCPPVTNGMPTCTTNGVCDFTCTPPYQKSGSSCACLQQCCTNTDCSGPTTCQNGQCQCDNTACTSYCAQMLCIGTCIVNTCQCACP